MINIFSVLNQLLREGERRIYPHHDVWLLSLTIMLFRIRDRATALRNVARFFVPTYTGSVLVDAVPE